MINHSINYFIRRHPPDGFSLCPIFFFFCFFLIHISPLRITHYSTTLAASAGMLEPSAAGRSRPSSWSSCTGAAGGRPSDVAGTFRRRGRPFPLPPPLPPSLTTPKTKRTTSKSTTDDGGGGCDGNCWPPCCHLPHRTALAPNDYRKRRRRQAFHQRRRRTSCCTPYAPVRPGSRAVSSPSDSSPAGRPSSPTDCHRRHHFRPAPYRCCCYCS